MKSTKLFLMLVISVHIVGVTKVNCSLSSNLFRFKPPKVATKKSYLLLPTMLRKFCKKINWYNVNASIFGLISILELKSVISQLLHARKELKNTNKFTDVTKQETKNLKIKKNLKQKIKIKEAKSGVSWGSYKPHGYHTVFNTVVMPPKEVYQRKMIEHRKSTKKFVLQHEVIHAEKRHTSKIVVALVLLPVAIQYGINAGNYLLKKGCRTFLPYNFRYITRAIEYASNFYAIKFLLQNKLFSVYRKYQEKKADIGAAKRVGVKTIKNQIIFFNSLDKKEKKSKKINEETIEFDDHPTLKERANYLKEYLQERTKKRSKKKSKK